MLHSFVKLHVFFVFFLIMANSAVAVELNKTTPTKTITVNLTCPSYVNENAENGRTGWEVKSFQSNFDSTHFIRSQVVCYYKPSTDPQPIYTSYATGKDCITATGTDYAVLDITARDFDGFVLRADTMRSYDKTESTSSGTKCYYSGHAQAGAVSALLYSSCKIDGRKATCKP